MFTKGDKVYADVGCYLRHKSLNIIMLSGFGDISDYNEYTLNSPLDIIVDKDKFFFNNRMFLCIPKTMDYVGIKTKLITSRYSNDDQIAIMLNASENNDDQIYLAKMQEWRNWAGEVAKKVMEVLKADNN